MTEKSLTDFMSDKEPRWPVRWWKAGAVLAHNIGPHGTVPDAADYVAMDDGSIWARSGDKWVPHRGSDPLAVEVQRKSKTAVGDVNSNERGAGARDNGTKAPMHYLPMRTLVRMAEGYLEVYALGGDKDGEQRIEHLIEVVDQVARFQEGDGDAMINAVKALVPEDFEGAARVLEAGAKKYAPWNWLKGMPWSVFYGCIWRHAMPMFANAQSIDPETSCLHWHHLVCNVVMLEQLSRSYPEGDDRPDPKFFGADNASA